MPTPDEPLLDEFDPLETLEPPAWPELEELAGYEEELEDDPDALPAPLLELLLEAPELPLELLLLEPLPEPPLEL